MSVIVTEKARKHIDRIKEQANKSYFRLHVKSAGCSGYRYDPQLLDQKLETDHEVLLDNEWSLLVSDDALSLVKGTTIDYVSKGLGSQLVFLNPNAEDECGCGESFNVPGDES